MEGLVLDPALERARFEARRPFLDRQAALRVDLAPGIFLQPETAESLADQVRETLWAEGKTPETCDPQELAEVRSSFAVLSTYRDGDGWSLAATLMIGLPEAGREARLRALDGFPEGLELECEDGRRVRPVVDRGLAPEGGRVPAVLALRWQIPGNGALRALVSDHRILSGRWPAPNQRAWTAC